MILHGRSYLVRFFAVDGEHRARVTDVGSSRSWTVADAASAGALQAQLVRDDRDAEPHASERPC